MTNGKPAAAVAPQRRRKVPMNNWYSPMILVATAIRVAISSVVGAFDRP